MTSLHAQGYLSSPKHPECSCPPPPGHLPDYACLIVGANMGVVGMCKEHLGVALALKVPVFFVITKVDICPEHVLKNTVQVRLLFWGGERGQEGGDEGAGRGRGTKAWRGAWLGG